MSISSTSSRDISFPQEVRQAIQQIPASSYGFDGRQLLVSAVAREQLQKWATQHDTFVRQSPLLRSIVQHIEGPKYHGHFITDEFCQKIEGRTYDFSDPANFAEIEQNMLLLQQYFEVGIVSWEQLVGSLSLINSKGRTYLHEPRHFVPSLAFLKKLSFERLIQLLSLQDLSGDPVLHYAAIFPLMLSHVIDERKCSATELQMFLGVRNSTGQTPFHLRSNFLAFHPYLEKLTFPLICKIVRLTELSGDTLFSNKEIFSAVYAHVEKKHPSRINELLAFEDEKGSPLLQHPRVSENALNYFLAEKQMSLSGLRQLFRLYDSQGISSLHCAKNFEKLVRFVIRRKEYAAEGLSEIFIFFDKRNRTLLDFLNRAPSLPFFKEITFDLWIDIVSVCYSEGLTALGTPGEFKQVLSFFLDKLLCTPKQLVQLVSLTDKKSCGPLDSPENFKTIIEIFKSREVSIEDCISIVSAESCGWPVFFYQHNFFQILDYFIFQRRCEFTQLISLLSVVSKGGFLPLMIPDNFALFFKYLQLFQPLQQNHFEELGLPVLSIHDRHGLSVLHYSSIFSLMMPHLELMSIQDAKKVFAIQTNKGDSLLHMRGLRLLAAGLIEAYEINLGQFVNNEGVTAQDLANCQLSEAWLRRPKIAQFLRQPISKEGYLPRAKALKVRVDILWQAVEEGYKLGNLSDSALYHEKTVYSLERIKRSLDQTLLDLQEQTPWRGTPEASDKAGLHQFYSAELIDFETIVAELEKRKSPIETAGHLLDIASVRLQGDCASGEVGILEQKREALTQEPSDLEGLVCKAASSTLRAHVDAIVSAQFHGNVHASNQLYYVAGITNHPDPHALNFELTEEQSRAWITNTWDPLKFYRDFGNKISNEMAIEWLLAHTPDDFGSEYLALKEKVHAEEEEIFRIFSQGIREQISNDKEAKALISVLQTLRAPSCVVSSLDTAQKTALLRRVFEEAALAKFIVVEDLETLSCAQLQEKIESIIKEQQKTLPRDREYLVQLRRLHDSKIKLSGQVEAIFQFHQCMQQHQVPATKWRSLLQIKQVYDKDIDTLGNDTLSAHNISYSAKDHKLPSRACEHARRLAYNHTWLHSRGQMLLRMLVQMGVILSQH